MIKALFKNFVSHRGGASAVEFGLIAPVLALMLVGIAEVGQVAYQRTDMHAALRSGGQYVLNGGRDLAVAREIVVRSWTAMPEDAVVETTRFCLCGETPHACNSPCSGGAVPEAYISLRAHATLGGIVIDYGSEADDAIRIR
jgi:Flp pilus assembly pilin Flp